MLYFLLISPSWYVNMIVFAKDTIRVAIGVPLRVKNRTAQNPIKYIGLNVDMLMLMLKWSKFDKMYLTRK